MKGLVFDVQRFSVHDGPGIRTTVFFKGCPLTCAWCQNPESMRREPEVAYYEERCRDLKDCEKGGECPYGARKAVGRWVGVDKLYNEVARDVPFYDSSGGGVTLSGGEPTLQLDFVIKFAKRCASEGLSVGLQTSGAFGYASIGPLLGYLSFVHFDLKLMDAAEHKRLTGTDNKTILENARKLVADDVEVVFRSPVVPGLTDTVENLDAIAAFVLEQGHRRLHLLRYHPMGEAKLPPLDFPRKPLELSWDDEGFERARERLIGLGLEISV